MQLEMSLIKERNPLRYLSYYLQRRKRIANNYKQLKELQEIIRNKSVNTFFQPLVHFKTGENIGYEIFNRPTVSSSFPTTEKFYDFVGQTNLVFSVEKVFREISLSRFRESLQEHPSEKEALIFLNVHPHILLDPLYRSGETLRLLKSFGISPEQIVFEISEKAAIDNYQHFEAVLRNYRSQGFRIALDDAGSGYNSLKTLVYLKPEFLKLDKALIQNIDQDKTKQQLVRILLDFSNQSDTCLIAEGVERREELCYLKDQGIHVGQGYAIGKPSQSLIKGTLD